VNINSAKNFSYKALIASISLFILFHIGILTKLIPYENTWGGQLENEAQMYVFETISILINAMLITILVLKANYVKNSLSPKLLNGILRAFQVLFTLNTVGNLFAKTYLEMSFSLVTLAFAVLIGIILKKPNQQN